MTKSISKTTRCTRCGSKKFSQVKFVACGAETKFRVVTSTDPMGKWYYFHENLEMWSFPLCDGCLHKGLLSHLSFEVARDIKLLYIFGTVFVVCLLASLFLIDPRPHSWRLWEVVTAFATFVGAFVSVIELVDVIIKRGRMKKLQLEAVITPGEYDSAFSGEAEHILRVRKGNIAHGIFSIPKFGAIPPETVRNASDLSRDLKVLAVGNTMREAIDRLPKEWKNQADHLSGA